MTIDEATRLLISSLGDLYDEREAASISSLVMERLTGMPKSLRLLHKTNPFTQREVELFQQYLSDLLRSRPVQYVLEEAWFGPLPFYVNESVLIPRPETEELAGWLLKDMTSVNLLSPVIMDIGTGSGCIAIYIKKKRSHFKVLAMDVSREALEIAEKNSGVHHADIGFFLCNILDPLAWINLPQVNCIISNPPYIPEKQKENLDRHVKEFEPELALFVPDSDPIIFYKHIAEFARNKLLAGGSVFFRNSS